MKLSIGFIGAGRVGVSLGRYFNANGLNVEGYYSRNVDSAKEAAEFTQSDFYTRLDMLIENCNVIFITTPDDIIKKVWNQIRKYDLKDKIICHSSGSLSSSIFSDINTSGAFGYSIHPMCAFSDKFTTYKVLKEIYFSIEGDYKYLKTLISIFTDMGNRVIVLDKDKKSLYHLANVTVSNLVLSLLNIGCEYLEKCGIDKDDCINALMPLIENNIDNIKKTGFVGALTGPVERRDLGTLKHHLHVIPHEDLELYRRLSMNLVKLSEKKHAKTSYSLVKKIWRLEDDEK